MSTVGFVNLILLRGNGLLAADLNGLSDPYCVMKLGEKVAARSRVIRETLDPEWNDAFVLFVADRRKEQSELKIEVYDEDLIGEDFLGSYTVSLADFPSWEYIKFNVKLQGVDQGVLSFEIRWVPIRNLGEESKSRQASKVAKDNRKEATDSESMEPLDCAEYWTDKYGFVKEMRDLPSEADYPEALRHEPASKHKLPGSANEIDAQGIPFPFKISCWLEYGEALAKEKQMERESRSLASIADSKKKANAILSSKPYLGPGAFQRCSALESKKINRDQIELDLPRTLPGHYAFHSSEGAEGKINLRRLLLAISSGLTIGYCQAMGKISAVLAMLADEERAFQLSVLLFNRIARDYYSVSMEGLLLDMKVLSTLMEKYFPKIKRHLSSLCLELEALCTPWFMTLFLDTFPFLTALRVWDHVFLHGTSGLIIVMMAFFKLHEKEILAIYDFMALRDFLKTTMGLTTDWEQLMKTTKTLFSFPSLSEIKNLQKTLLNATKNEVDTRAIDSVKLKATKSGIGLDSLSKLRDKFNQAESHGVVSKAHLSEMIVSNFQGSLANDREFLEFVADSFDENCDGQIDWKEYCLGLTLLSSGTVENKMQFCFSLFDLDKNGKLDKPEFRRILELQNRIDGCFKSEEEITRALDALYRNYQSEPNVLTLDEFKLACLDSEPIRRLFSIHEGIGL